MHNPVDWYPWGAEGLDRATVGFETVSQFGHEVSLVVIRDRIG